MPSNPDGSFDMELPQLSGAVQTSPLPIADSKSSIRHLLDKNGDGITLSMIDDAVQTLALVCALVLTIPYGLISGMDSAFWDNIDLISCKVPQIQCQVHVWDILNYSSHRVLRNCGFDINMRFLLAEAG